MNVAFFIDLCGLPLLVVLIAIEIALVAAACYLFWSARRTDLLTAFLPLTAAPIVAGLSSTLVGLVSSIGLQLNESVDYQIDPGFLLQMNLVPLVASCIVALPAASIAAIGRYWLTWQESGLRLFPEREKKDDDSSTDDRDWVTKEADDYLERLVKAR